MKVYVVISSYQHGLGEAVETDAEVFDTRDKARKAIRHKENEHFGELQASFELR